jgi:hypothetical protein
MRRKPLFVVLFAAALQMSKVTLVCRPKVRNTPLKLAIKGKRHDTYANLIISVGV